MQQRVAIAQTLIKRPRIVLMDEPFGALDAGVREDMQVLLLELWEAYGMTVFFVTHDLEEAVYLGTRVLVLSQYYTDDRGPGRRRRRAGRGSWPITPCRAAPCRPWPSRRPNSTSWCCRSATRASIPRICGTCAISTSSIPTRSRR